MLLCNICLAVLLFAREGAAPLSAVGAPGGICSTLVSPPRVPPATRLLLAVPVPSRGSAPSAAPVQLCEMRAGGAARPFFQPIPSTDLDVAADGRALAYGDGRGRLHLVDPVRGRDAVVGRGVGPRFSPDGRALAFIASATAPLPGAPEWLEVYRPATARLTRLGAAVVLRTGRYDPGSLVAWAPRGERIAWLRTDPSSHGFALSIATLQGSTASVMQAPVGDIASGPAWSVAGDRVLYWHAAAPVRHATAAAYSVVGWPPPHGPTRAVVPATPTAWFEGVAPAPVPSPSGAVIASLLGAPRGGLDQILLYRTGQAPRAIRLPGEPAAVRFAAGGTRLAVIWTRPQASGPVSHAGLVDLVSGRVRDLGPALAAFWISSP